MKLRQAKKNLKKQVADLKQDNNLMRKIISNYPEMSSLYDKYKEPLKVVAMPFQDLSATEMMLPIEYNYIDEDLMKTKLAAELADGIKDFIKIDVSKERHLHTVLYRIDARLRVCKL